MADAPLMDGKPLTPEDQLEARAWALMVERERDVLRALSAELHRALRIHLRHGRTLDECLWLCSVRGSVDAAVTLLEQALRSGSGSGSGSGEAGASR